VRISKRLAEAILTWQEQSARARKDALHYFRDEATQSDDWARHEREMGRGDNGKEYRRHREDASAMRAAVAVLKAAAGRAVSSTKRSPR
jgi:hypothetical protein